MISTYLNKVLLALLFITGGDNNNITPSVTCRVHTVPEVTVMNGTAIAYYELQVEMESGDSLILKSLTIKSAEDGAALAVLSGKELDRRTAPLPASTLPNGSAQGKQKVVYLELPLKGFTKDRINVVHELELMYWQEGKQREAVVVSTAVEIENKLPLLLSAPFAKGVWAAIHYPDWERGHRRVFYGNPGRPCLPGRYAIDFIQLDDEGRYAKNNEDSIINWYSYGVPVLAVADGIVTSTRTDFSESATISGHPRYGPQDATGNYISVKVSEGKFVFYEHLQPGSIRVKVGDRITKGTAIAAVGFTGQTTGPHLHLHIANTDASIEAEGLPYVFDGFRLLGGYDDFSKFGKKRWKEIPGKSRLVKKECPGANTVIRFDKRQSD